MVPRRVPFDRSQGGGSDVEGLPVINVDGYLEQNRAQGKSWWRPPAKFFRPRDDPKVVPQQASLVLGDRNETWSSPDTLLL